MIATNKPWAISTDGADERRYFVLEVSAKHAKDRKYWVPLVEQMKTEAALRAMLHDLVHMRCPKCVDLNDPPQTPWLADQAEHSMPVEAKWLLHVLKDEVISVPTRDGFGGSSSDAVRIGVGDGLLEAAKCSSFIKTDDAFKAFTDFAKSITGKASRVTPEDLGRFLARFGVMKARKRISGERPYLYEFGDLEERRAAFTKKYGVRFGDAGADIDLAGYGLDTLAEDDLRDLDAWRRYGAGLGALPA